MDPDVTDKKAADVSALLTDLFEIGAVYRQQEGLLFSLNYRFERRRSVRMIRERLKTAGYSFTLTEREQVLLLQIDPRRRLRIPNVNIVLFVLTLFSVYFVPVFLRNLPPTMYRLYQDMVVPPQSFLDELRLVGDAVLPTLTATMQDLAGGAGLVFTLALISILFVHEMGHYVAGHRRGIVTSWPYFIPAPNIIGTFGAVIKAKSPFWNRRDLIEVGAAGPIAGWLVAIGWLVWGLSGSSIVSPEILGLKEFGFSLEGESLLMRAATLTIVGPAADGLYYRLSEAAFAGWVGILITAINLLPIGQLDGGHIVYGLGRRWQHWLARLAVAALLVLGFQSVMWWVFAGFGLVFGMRHPPTLQDGQELPPAAVVMGVVSLVILVVSFTPIPFR